MQQRLIAMDIAAADRRKYRTADLCAQFCCFIMRGYFPDMTVSIQTLKIRAQNTPVGYVALTCCTFCRYVNLFCKRMCGINDLMNMFSFNQLDKAISI